MGEKIINVAIDGPAGAGKSTIAKIVAKKMGYIYVDTGAMYRGMALACEREGLNSDENDEVLKEKAVKVCSNISLKIKYIDNEQVVTLNDENVNPYIRTESISRMASKISAYPEIRSILTDIQKNIAKETSIIMDGRDIGTSVLPNADVKIYLTASVETRAKRRYDEQLAKGAEKVTLEDIKNDIEERDYRDMHRECSPLKQAEDAYLLDSSEKTVEEVVDEITGVIESCLN